MPDQGERHGGGSVPVALVTHFACREDIDIAIMEHCLPRDRPELPLGQGSDLTCACRRPSPRRPPSATNTAISSRTPCAGSFADCSAMGPLP